MLRDIVIVFLIVVFIMPILVVLGFGFTGFLAGVWSSFFPERQYHLTCYSPDLAITYMSIEPVYMANEYGVWKFASGKGAYIQQSGDTCVTDEVVESIPQGAP